MRIEVPVNAQGLAELRNLVTRAKLERDKPQTEYLRHPRGPRIRYATDEERQDARKKSWNASKKRLYGSCPKCGGPKAAHPSVAMCRSCWSKVHKGDLARD